MFSRVRVKPRLRFGDRDGTRHVAGSSPSSAEGQPLHHGGGGGCFVGADLPCPRPDPGPSRPHPRPGPSCPSASPPQVTKVSPNIMEAPVVYGNGSYYGPPIYFHGTGVRAPPCGRGGCGGGPRGDQTPRRGFAGEAGGVCRPGFPDVRTDLRVWKRVVCIACPQPLEMSGAPVGGGVTLGSANVKATPAGTPAAAAVRPQRPDATCEGEHG